MEKFANDNLILLEFLVDNVNFEYSVQQSLKCMQGETCVAFQFLDNSPLYVCEEDFAPKSRNYADGCGGCSTMKNGKSCLFALNPKQAEECMKQFDIYVEVFRRMPAGMLPEKLMLGESLISILNLFHEMVIAFNGSVDDTPIAKTLKDCFKIQNTNGELVGRIGVYIRMSTFGKLIVTQFQMNLQDKSVEFKAKEGHYLFTTKTNKADPTKKQKIMNESLSAKNVFDIPCGKPKEDVRRPCGNEPMSCPRPAPTCPAQPPRAQPPRPSTPLEPQPFCQPPPCKQCSCGPPPSSPPQSNYQSPPPCPPPPCYQPPPCAPPPCDPACCPPQQPYPPQSNYRPPPCAPPPCDPVCCPPQPPYPPQTNNCCAMCGRCPPQTCPACGQSTAQVIESPCEIFQRQMQGNQNNNMVIPCVECNDRYQNPPVPAPPANCDYQEFGAEMGGNSLIIRVHKDNAKVEQVTNEQCCCESGDNRGKPKPAVYQVTSPSPCCCINQGGGRAPAEGNPAALCPSCCPDNNAPFTFKMGGATQANNNISLISPTNTAKHGGKLGMLTDPTKEVFILRIGKKNECSSKKNNMEIELCTPRGKEYKPPPKLIEIEQQCEPDAGGKKKKKGKGGKGGKKGKKGKGKKGKKGKGGKKKK